MLQGSPRLWRSVSCEKRSAQIGWQTVSSATNTEVLEESVVSGRQCKHVPTQVRSASGILIMSGRQPGVYTVSAVI